VPSTSVLIPYRTADRQRQRIWSRLKELWALAYPQWEIVEGSDGKKGPWVKGRAWWDALERSSGEIVVFCDADCWLPEVGRGVMALQHGAEWVQCQDYVWRLSQEATEAVLAGALPMDAVQLGLQDGEPPLRSNAGVGTILWRKDALAVPIDPRFVGWGWEDTAWNDALTSTLGAQFRLEHSICLHLWHEPQPDKDRNAMPPNRMLRRRYARAMKDREEMSALVAEARALISDV